MQLQKLILKMIDYELVCNDVIKLAKKTGSFIRNEKQGFSFDKVETKSLNSFVSYVDKNAEQIIVDGLKQILAEAGFITEEETETITAEKYNWIVDPLDGTTNFIHGVEPFSVSIALKENDNIVIGVVYEIGKDECFYAYKNSPAYLNGKEIKVTQTNKLANSLIATGFPYYDFSKTKKFLASLDFFMRNTHGVRRFGSAATDLAYIACGRFDAFYEYGLNAWDVAAGLFIVKQAGGKVTDYSGGEDYLFGREIIATNNNVYNEFAAIIKRLF